MYDKIAVSMNRNYGCIDISAEDVEGYLRHGNDKLITEEEIALIEMLVEQYI